MSAFELLMTALPSKAAINADGSSRPLMTHSGHEPATQTKAATPKNRRFFA